MSEKNSEGAQARLILPGWVRGLPGDFGLTGPSLLAPRGEGLPMDSAQEGFVAFGEAFDGNDMLLPLARRLVLDISSRRRILFRYGDRPNDAPLLAVEFATAHPDPWWDAVHSRRSCSVLIEGVQGLGRAGPREADTRGWTHAVEVPLQVFAWSEGVGSHAERAGRVHRTEDTVHEGFDFGRGTTPLDARIGALLEDFDFDPRAWPEAAWQRARQTSFYLDARRRWRLAAAEGLPEWLVHIIDTVSLPGALARVPAPVIAAAVGRDWFTLADRSPEELTVATLPGQVPDIESVKEACRIAAAAAPARWALDVYLVTPTADGAIIAVPRQLTLTDGVSARDRQRLSTLLGEPGPPRPIWTEEPAWVSEALGAPLVRPESTAAISWQLHPWQWK
ncbi:hypothetical protein [Arthrobacter bambusae]|uniref:Uncharacterized protein n=1 Tax=Arthrobacter bambusae TaxID=1338426 RepID=A0AAW8DDR8_9MICC|nr:hypothetical protein [Arthrobacter bambusae]MDP9904648.1 hypothetical protein [Arthrobacter bambusae]MDQ0129464.1 hypothetical protein [Arthrobacter bambusae]MDQ0180923.1 hypothetical protein [Arthrobacter bambusae]